MLGASLEDCIGPISLKRFQPHNQEKYLMSELLKRLAPETLAKVKQHLPALDAGYYKVFGQKRAFQYWYVTATVLPAVAASASLWRLRFYDTTDFFVLFRDGPESI